MYSSPIMGKYDKLNPNKCWINLKESLKKTGLLLRIKKVCGMKENIDQLTRSSTLCAVFFGHGIDFKKLGPDKQKCYQEHQLILENKFGGPEPYSFQNFAENFKDQ